MFTIAILFRSVKSSLYCCAGVNSNVLGSSNNPGKDGAAGPNAQVAVDAFSYSLHYFNGDYLSIGTQSANFIATQAAGSNLGQLKKDLYNGSGTLERSTNYVNDATGNVMSTYELVIDNVAQKVKFHQSEKYIYGTALLGVMADSISMLGTQNSTYSQKMWSHKVGMRNYHLANHLGSILAVVSDKVVPHDGGGGTVDYYMADILQSQDYSPFGVTLYGRGFTKSTVWRETRRGYQGSEADDELKGDDNSYTTFFRQLDPRLGRWLSLDPKASSMPFQSPYCSMDNNPIWFNDPNGDIPPVIVAVAFVIADVVVATTIVKGVKEQGKIMHQTPGNRNARESGYFLDHPFNAEKAKEASTIVGNFSINISRSIGKQLNEDCTPQNALRHTMWNALMGKSMGKEQATNAANSHETDTKIKWDQMTFEFDWEADKSIDLRNNIIGRRIAEENKGLSNVELMRKVLDEYHDKGLWTGKKVGEKWVISKTKMSDADYKKAIAELNKAGEDGKHKK